jgi:hypothetical protein
MAYTVGEARPTRQRAPKRLRKVPRRRLVRRRRQPGLQWPNPISSSSSIRDVKQQTYSLADDKTQLEDLWRSETQAGEPKKCRRAAAVPPTETRARRAGRHYRHRLQRRAIAACYVPCERRHHKRASRDGEKLTSCYSRCCRREQE